MSNSQIVRTRFAPSPTGYLHIGGARTALFSYLLARHLGGQFVLRVEDTDKERSTEESTQAILDGMAWLGLDYDEGPYFQSQRSCQYEQAINSLLAAGHAYRCTCSKAHLEELRAQQMAAKQKPRYDGCCRKADHQDNGQDFVIRFANPTEGSVVFDDLIRGRIEVNNAELDDLIIARSDGSPTYNLTVVVDDSDMNITHVVRGDDHINNTPRQINLLHALDKPIPYYAHVPMILGADSKRLSKRHGAVSVLQYQQEGFLAKALLNYLVRLGWSHGDQELFSKEQMIALFSLQAVNKSPASFNLEKLVWVNQHYLKQGDYQEALLLQFEKAGIDITQGPALDAIIVLQKERCKTLCEMAERSRYFFEERVVLDEKAARKHLTATVKPVLQTIYDAFAKLKNWQQDVIHPIIVSTAAVSDVKLGKVAQPLRVAVTGNTISPPIDVTLEYIGQERVLQRLENALAYIDSAVDQVS